MFRDKPSTIDDVLEAIGHFSTNVDKQFQGVNVRLDGIDVRLDGIDVRLDSIEEKISRIELDLADIKDRLEKLEIRTKEDTDAYVGDILDLKARVAAMEKQLQAIQSGQATQ